MSADIFSAMKAIQWERAKGELRAMVALVGSQPFDWKAEKRGEENPFDLLDTEIKKFITRIEDAGLHE